jgi:hypothetical protein
MTDQPIVTPPPVLPGNGPTIAGSPWLIEQDQAAQDAQTMTPAPEPQP